MNDLERFRSAFAGLDPWSGTPPRGFYPDWLGALTDAAFRAYTGMRPEDVGGAPVATRLPVLADGEGWFEAVAQVEAAREARGRYVMVTLGACYGAQAVGAWLALQKLNPMPATLVAVEPEPGNLAWTARHFRDNGIDPDEHWLIGSAISDSNEPVFFPVGSPGSGAQNLIVTNEPRARRAYVDSLAASGEGARQALRNLLLHNTTGLKRDLVSGEEIGWRRSLRSRAMRRGLGALRRLRSAFVRPLEVKDRSAATGSAFSFEAEIRLVSAVTLKDVLGPFARVDYLEADIQQSEAVVFPPFMDVLGRKVRRVHVGTHGRKVHAELAELFRRHGWDIVFDYAPNTQYQTAMGNFALNDGVLTALNPALEPS